MRRAIGLAMCLPHHHHTGALPFSLSRCRAAAWARPVKDNPYVLKYAAFLVDSMHITTLSARHWFTAMTLSSMCGDGNATRPENPSPEEGLPNAASIAKSVVREQLASRRVPKLPAQRSRCPLVRRGLVAPWSPSLNDYPAQAMARPERYINTSRMTPAPHGMVVPTSCPNPAACIANAL